MKIFRKFSQFILPATVLFLIAFIPLYPKLPLVDIKNTWVYVRVEDFLVFFVLAIWFYLLFKKEVTLKTPLTIPILIFWIIGAIATIHGVVIIFPTIAHVFPNVALLAYLRHIEYLSLFFVAYSAVRSQKFVLASIWTVIATLLAVVAYGFGQKYLSFPAFLTMNEEYAKGVPVTLSALSRIPSTFAGHYDLAAYLVLIIPILVSLFFGYKNLFIKIFLIISSFLGFILLFLTVSRVSFFVLFISLFFVFLFNKKKSILILTPIVVVAGIVLIFTQQSSLMARFGNTIKEVDVLIDATSGNAIGHVNFQQRSYLYDKIILHDPQAEGTVAAITEFDRANAIKEGVPTHLIPYRLPKKPAIVPAEVTSTGETLPQGSGYINLTLSPVTKRLNGFFYEYPVEEGTTSASVKFVPGEFLVKRASAYDLSFTTRFQGEWPNALKAFGRNLFFGSGYGSVSLAVDNNYYRMLGETGFLGTLSFITVFVVFGLYIRRTLPHVESRVIRAFILGLAAGIIGLSLNAILIDVFEASKVAFQLWLLVGIACGALALYQSKKFNPYKELLQALVSPIAIIIYILLLVLVIYSPVLTTFFIGDDFTWFRWAADCKLPGNSCGSPLSVIQQYFFNSEGFFYRPGTKAYFYLMYPTFWLNEVIYHAVSIVLHFIVVTLMYLISRKILKNNLLAAGIGFVFLIASGYLEIVYWIAATGHLFNAVFILMSFYLFIKWDENRNSFFFIGSIVSSFLALFFHELGIISPFLALSYLVAYRTQFTKRAILNLLSNKILYLLFIPNITYFILRSISHTHWFQGDYSYNLVKLPFNVIGNLFGYSLISLFGPITYPAYEKLRLLTKSNIPLAIIFGLILLIGLYFGVKIIRKRLPTSEQRIILFFLLYFFVCLIPFLGLGNISFRYSYLASFGVIAIALFLVGKLYKVLLSNGKDIAYFAVAMLVTVFCLLHIIQSQQIAIEWNGAGQKVKNFITSIDSLYSDNWSNKNYQVGLYFVDVPIKNGNAWIFPVGIEDAVWFAFRNENITIHKAIDINQIPEDKFSALDSWIFKFQSDGSLRQYIWSKKGPIEYEK